MIYLYHTSEHITNYKYAYKITNKFYKNIMPI